MKDWIIPIYAIRNRVLLLSSGILTVCSNLGFMERTVLSFNDVSLWGRLFSSALKDVRPKNFA